MVKVLWCWRCRMEIPMLDEQEFSELHPLLSDGLRATKEFRAKHGLPLEKVDMNQRFKPALDVYERVTGFRETNPNALWHHRISLYGPLCTKCNRPRRTPQARHCVDCDE